MTNKIKVYVKDNKKKILTVAGVVVAIVGIGAITILGVNSYKQSKRIDKLTNENKKIVKINNLKEQYNVKLKKNVEDLDVNIKDLEVGMEKLSSDKEKLTKQNLGVMDIIQNREKEIETLKKNIASKRANEEKAQLVATKKVEEKANESSIGTVKSTEKKVEEKVEEKSQPNTPTEKPTPIEKAKAKVETQQVASRGGGGSPSGRTMTMQASAYSVNEVGMGSVTANGTHINSGSRVVAVDPNVIPLGSRVHIEGYGTYSVADTGGAIKGNRIDIHMPSVGACTSFGRRNVKVTVLN